MLNEVLDVIHEKGWELYPVLNFSNDAEIVRNGPALSIKYYQAYRILPKEKHAQKPEYVLGINKLLNFEGYGTKIRDYETECVVFHPDQLVAIGLDMRTYCANLVTLVETLPKI